MFNKNWHIPSHMLPAEFTPSFFIYSGYTKPKSQQIGEPHPISYSTEKAQNEKAYAMRELKLRDFFWAGPPPDTVVVNVPGVMGAARRWAGSGSSKEELGAFFWGKPLRAEPVTQGWKPSWLFAELLNTS